MKQGFERCVDFFYDYASPYSFFANLRLQRYLPGVTINYKPIYLRGFDTFKKGVPYSQCKFFYILEDCQRIANIDGIKVNPGALIVNGQYEPVNGLYAARGALVAKQLGVFDAYHSLIFSAAWQHGVNISDKHTLVDTVKEIGIDPIAFHENIESENIKQQLKDETNTAIKKQLFGVPSFIVNGKLVWGCDRFDHIQWLLD